ncbi:EVE domain-containing protein [Xanthomarina spongicola]|uniref:Dynein-related subfamily AAA family protein n=1 Tax=Xanthomarina spongicola TaxID=570520 RepID=A0A316DMY6_9FLAO|nr:EVE domain-containing protein [Xanthomarina spongicola]PWK18559.1 dynein-related subfamily AAA family protein [Xanthomarina spongicola]
MIFDRVKKEHILHAIKDFEEKGYPKEFGPSSTYDLVYESKHYPPKAIMAYANYHAEGRAIERYFKGGLGTDCFNAFEKNGFEIILKPNKKMNLKKEFIKWLHKNTKEGSNRVSSYSKAIDLLNKILDYNVYETDNLKLLNGLYKELIVEQRTIGGKYYVEKSPSYGTNGFYSASIKKYIEFLEQKSGDINNNSMDLVLKGLISSYKDKIKDKKLKDEKYKWEFISEYHGKPDVDASNFEEEIKSIKWNNLTYRLSGSVLNHIVTDRPEELRSLFKALFNNSTLLKDRVNKWDQDLLEVYRDLNEEHYHHQDERAISVYLTLQYPETYTFYKSSYYKKFCEILGIEPKGKGEKYDHYMELINMFVNDYISKDQNLVEQLKTIIPKHYDGSNNLLVAQDILFQVLDQERVPNYWIFQCSPNIYNITDALKAAHVKSWKVAAHKDKIKHGDKVILWVTGREAGCYALAEVTSEVGVFEEENNEKQYYISGNDSGETERVKIKITKYLAEDPVFWYSIKDNPKFSNFNAGNQGTNFNATEKEYNAILELIDGKMNTQVKGLFELYRDYLIETRKNEISESTIAGYVETASIKIPSRWEESYGVSFDLFQLNIKDLKKILSLTDKGFSGYTSFSPFIYDLIENYEVKEPMNQILYGPPGTGKTYYLKDQLFDNYTLKETSITKAQHFETVVSGCSWWQVIAIALLDLGDSKVSDIFNHVWIQKKASLSNSKTIRPTLWGQLQSHTINECEYVNVSSRQQPLIFNKTEDSYWEILEDQVKELVPELYDLKDSVDNYNPDPDKIIKNFDFVTFHQSFAYEDFIEGIKPILPENGEEATDLGYTIEDGVFKKICIKAKNDPYNRYAIFIDEINRGNVSAIFGELITLIETDKRQGTTNELNIKLPYSKKEFSVPSNLDIYGTMNTADRSVEALDTALRRRFEFKEMMPDYSVIEEEFVEDVVLSEVLQTINQRIELLIDRDHTIGHSYFVGVDTEEKLANAFNNKIVPLLQEYFYGDYGKIGLVLGKGFVDKIKNDKTEFANFDYDNANDFKTPTFILKKVDEETIIDAVTMLLGVNETTLR